MFIIGKWSMKILTHLIIILTSVLQVKTSSLFCIPDKQYYNATEKHCLPCTRCTSPLIVIATCTEYSNSKCGLPSFNNGPFLEVLQKEVSENKDLINDTSQSSNSTINKIKKLNVKKFRKEGKKIQKNFKKYKRKFKKKNRKKKFSKALSKLSFSSLSDNENITNFLSDMSTENVKSNRENTYEQNIKENITEKFIPVYKEDFKRNSPALSIGKYFILFAICTFNIILITILIIKLISLSCSKRSKDKNSAFTGNQKLPHPSQKPIKCRFTAVLPSKSPQYANVDSYLKPISLAESSGTQEVIDDACPSSTPFQATQESSDGPILNSLSLNAERDSTLNPLLPLNQEVIESANTIQLYTRIPSPNPFTMDRLLEQRRAVGYSSVENNLYVETWCSSPSPMLPRSLESSVAPSPALSGVRKPFSGFPGVTSSNTSSPLTTRTFRATPAFTSFHPFRT